MATFSEMTITFTNDWVNDDTFKIHYYDGALSTQEWTWVTSRSSGFEVTTGSVTGNAGERAAIQFEAAFDLDNTSGYITTVQNTNEVLIKSETSGQDFVAVRLGDSQTGTATYVFNNFVTPATPANVSMALTRSPHLVNLPFRFDETTKVTITIYVWDGDLTSVPGTPTKIQTKIRPTINFAEFNPDLSNIIRESLIETPVFDISSTTQIVNSNTDNVKWVKFVASYTDTVNTIADIEDTFVAADGYGYYVDGVNPSFLSNRVLTDVALRKIDRSSFILFPFINDGTITSIDIDTEGAEINATETPSSTNQSTAYVQYISVDVSQTTDDEFLTITINPAGTEYVYEIIDECKYDPFTIVFLNRYGVFETLTMFKKSTTTIEVESEEFINNSISAGVYDVTKHQFQKINVTAKENITLNSGYIKEDENELYKQMILSEKVFFYDSAYIPVNVATTSLEFLTRINDSLVKYTINFDYAYNVINNI